MGLSARLRRVIASALLVLLVLACLHLIGQMRGFLADVWAVIAAVLTPVLISVVLSYVLYPGVALLQRRGVPRVAAILLLYVLVAVLIAILALNTFPRLVTQLVEFGRALPHLMATADRWIDALTSRTRYLPDSVRIAVEKNLASGESVIAGLIASVLNNVTKLLGQAFNALVIPFLVFYMLKDHEQMQNACYQLLPAKHRDGVRELVREVDQAVGAYVRGQLLVMAIVGILTYAGLLVVKMPFALLFALLVALTNVIPYLGPLIGAAPALIVALTVSPWLALKVALVNFIVQQLEGNLISPQVVGRSLRLHPVVLIMALLVAGEIGGPVGLMVAVPLVAVAKVVLGHVRGGAREN